MSKKQIRNVPASIRSKLLQLSKQRGEDYNYKNNALCLGSALVQTRFQVPALWVDGWCQMVFCAFCRDDRLSKDRARVLSAGYYMP